ncbi:MAG: carboxylating nicotinate-nucleotide diphosphorylase [Acidobacteriota bacterium]
MNRTDTLLWLAIQEDVGYGDVTSQATIGPDLMGTAVVYGREDFILSGSVAFRRVFELVDPDVRVEHLFRDGDLVKANAPALRMAGRVRSLLTAERTALNLLQRLSGVATLTRRMVDAVAGTNCRLLDTRKTTPLWRELEKEAVRHGGGANHRFGLSDGILIKDNHIAAVGGVGEAVRRARSAAPHVLKVEVEVEDLDGLREGLEAGADIIMLDNFSLDLMKEAVAINNGRALLEASGGVKLETVRAIAETGVNFVSCGALTHSAKAIDITMEMEFAQG